MSNLADRIIKHVDDLVLERISEYDLALQVDFEVHNWLKEQEEAISEDLIKWILQTNKKGGQ
jgi:hypothetical protein